MHLLRNEEGENLVMCFVQQLHMYTVNYTYMYMYVHMCIVLDVHVHVVHVCCCGHIIVICLQFVMFWCVCLIDLKTSHRPYTCTCSLGTCAYIQVYWYIYMLYVCCIHVCVITTMLCICMWSLHWVRSLYDHVISTMHVHACM